MDRRRFLKGLGVTALALPTLLKQTRAHALVSGDETLVVSLHADGGWDPACLCDPKGYVGDGADRITDFREGDIVSVGAFDLAPNRALIDFFSDYAQELLVLNGVDNQSNSHLAGVRNQWSGQLNHGHPSIGALAAAHTRNAPTTAYMSFGGYDNTAGLLPITRLPSPGFVSELAHPYRRHAPDPDSDLVPSSIQERLQLAQTARLERQLASATLPNQRRAMQRLLDARIGENEMARLAPFLPSQFESTPLKQQIQIALAAFQAGITSSVSLTSGGFDTHKAHDTKHPIAVTNLFEGALFLMQQAEELGLADRILLLIGSDFGRTPWYNEQDGKDHYSITSMMMMGPGIDGGRVIGSTDDSLVPDLLDPDTLELSDDGIRITPAHIHATLREYLGVDTREVAGAWPLQDDALPLMA